MLELAPARARILHTAPNDPRDLANLWAVESVTAKQTRGRVRRPMRNMLWVRRAYVQRNGRSITTQAFCGVKADGELVDITNINADTIYGPNAELQLAIRTACGIAMRMEYSWTVDLAALDGEFTITVPTTPEGARKLLSLRDVPADASRRKALRHWVAEHHRVVRKGEVNEDTVLVSEHLRGVTPFKWDDLRGVVRPSPYDLRRANVH